MPRTMLDRFEQRKATRAKLVDAALQLFSTSGYEHATVDDISQAAGYSKGAYYFHFSTKDDILLELLRMWTEDRSAALAGASEESSSVRVFGTRLPPSCRTTHRLDGRECCWSSGPRRSGTPKSASG